MFHITKEDKKEILQILLEYDCRCKMNILVNNFNYLNDKKTKRAKIREIIKVLNKELKQSVKAEIVEKEGLVEIIYY